MKIRIKINVVSMAIAFDSTTFLQTACCISQCQRTARGIGQAGGANRDDKHCRRLHLFSLHTPSFSSAEKETFPCVFTQSEGPIVCCSFGVFKTVANLPLGFILILRETL